MEKLPAAQLAQKAQNLLTLSKHGPFWNALCQAARSEKSELADKDIETLVKAYYSPIRACNELDVKSSLIVELEYCARTYGARNADHIEDVLVEAIELITTRFRGLSTMEIRLAFQLKASGVIRPVGAEMYGGSFNAEVLGKILTSYRDWRIAALKPIIQKLEEVKEQQEQQDRADKARRAFDASFIESLNEAKKYTEWHQVPEYLFESCKKRGFVALTKQQGEIILERAKGLAVEEEIAERQTKTMFQLRVGQPIDLEARAKIIARKIVVLEHVLHNPDCIAWAGGSTG